MQPLGPNHWGREHLGGFFLAQSRGWIRVTGAQGCRGVVFPGSFKEYLSLDLSSPTAAQRPSALASCLAFSRALSAAPS